MALAQQPTRSPHLLLAYAVQHARNAIDHAGAVPGTLEKRLRATLTALAIVTTDLLVGVAVGIVVKMVLCAWFVASVEARLLRTAHFSVRSGYCSETQSSIVN